MWAINLHCWRQRQGNSNDEAMKVVVERGGTWWNLVERGVLQASPDFGEMDNP